MRYAWSAWALALSVVAGCASGQNNDDGPGVLSSLSDGDTQPPSDDDGTGDDDTGADDKPEDDTADDAPAPPPPPDTTGGADGTTGDDGTGDTSGTPVNCDDGSTCPGAAVLGGIAGDESSSQLTTDGDTNTWVTFQVSENNSDVVGEQLSFTASLTSPAGLDYDLHVFRGLEGGATGCGGQQGQSTNAVGIDSVSMSWGEGALANNLDDSAWVAIEIRSKDGVCMPGATWTLTVVGDT